MAALQGNTTQKHAGKSGDRHGWQCRLCLTISSDHPAQIPNNNSSIPLLYPGIGFEACLNLAKAGAHVIVAARNHQRGTAAVAHITQQVPHASVEFAQVDMSSVASIIAFSEWFYQKHKGLLHVLIQNAGVFLQPASITADGLEVCARGGVVLFEF